MTNDQTDPQLAEADPQLQARFARLGNEGWTSALDRKLELDRVEIATDLLRFLRRARLWAENEVVPRDVASEAIEAFMALDWLTKRGISPRLGTYGGHPTILNAARVLTFNVLVGDSV